MNALEPVTSLSLQHPKLIDWNSSSLTSKFLTFQNDYALTYYLNTVEPVVSSTSEKSVSMIKGDINYLNRKIKWKKNKHSDGENHIMAMSEPKKLKRKDISDGQNLSEAPEDEILDALLSHFQERSLVLIEPTQPVNLGTEEEPQIIH